MGQFPLDQSCAHLGPDVPRNGVQVGGGQQVGQLSAHLTEPLAPRTEHPDALAEDGLGGRVGDGGELRVEVGGLSGITGWGDAGWQRGAGGGDDAGDLGLDAGVEICLRRLEIRNAGLQGSGFTLGCIALGFERVDFGSQ